MQPAMVPQPARRRGPVESRKWNSNQLALVQDLHRARQALDSIQGKLLALQTILENYGPVFTDTLNDASGELTIPAGDGLNELTQRFRQLALRIQSGGEHLA